MDKSTSLYLDFCRVGAAFAVFVHHFFSPPFYDGDIRIHFGRQAVVVFFVISGFVIAYVADQKETKGTVYCANRAARLYSVVLPALFLTLALDGAVGLIAPQLYEPAVHSQLVFRFLGSLLFLNQSWNLTMAAFSNGPFWSLCYEFWYYVIFGLFVFGPPRAKVPLAILAAIVAGPRIILLFPVWLLGVATYRFRNQMRHISTAPIIFVASSLIFMWIAAGGVSLLNNSIVQLDAMLSDGYLFASSPFRIFIGGDVTFPADYALGIAFSLSLLTASSAAKYVPANAFVSRVIRYCATYTFSLYLFHVPLLLLFAALTYRLESHILRSVLTFVPTLLSVWVIGSFTEQRQGGYRRFFLSIFERKQLALDR